VAGVAQPTPAQRLQHVRASVLIADLVAGTDPGGAAKLRAILTAAPPRELPGCARCPDRCRALTALAGKKHVIEMVGRQVDGAADPAVRLENVRDLLGVHVRGDVRPEALAHCAITLAKPQGDPRAQAMLDLQ
jgi:hypothetical protein